MFEFLLIAAIVVLIAFYINNKTEAEDEKQRKILEEKRIAEEKAERTDKLRNAFQANPLAQKIGKEIAEKTKTNIEDLLNHPTTDRHSPRVSRGMSIKVCSSHIIYGIDNRYQKIVFDSDDYLSRYQNLNNEEEIDAFLHALVKILDDELKVYRSKGIRYEYQYEKSKNECCKYYLLTYSIENRNYDTEQKSWY